MEKFRKVEAVAAPMLRDNIDTDAIIPVARMKVLSTHLGHDLFANLRYRPDGSEDPEFVLNQPEYRNAQIIVAGDNFACGSSREHAVWALMDFGVRCVIAESFGDIFYNNSFRMGLLPVVLARRETDALAHSITTANSPGKVVVDLERETVTSPDGAVYRFQIDADRKQALLEGLDAVGVTLAEAGRIAEFQARDRIRRPWVYDIEPRDGTPPLNSADKARPQAGGHPPGDAARGDRKLTTS